MHPSSDQIRQTFIDYFAKRQGHTHWPSSPCVPHDDPTLLFTNAGMNQFKPIFLGQVAPGSPMAGLKRAVNSQKCIRAGGKHNDLEDVGKDTYHHTFFEMLGNWSFGDYFKDEATAWSWELLTSVYGINPDRLYATYFEGNAALGLPPDEETRQFWLRYLPSDHVLPGNMKDNFWEMGDTGPCGPCTEIHYDRIGDRNAAHLVNTGDPDVIEIWNNVFIQFNREEGGGLKPLPARHVDTGMGFERLTSVLQNVRSNYDTDIFAPIFLSIERLTGARPYGGRLGAADRDNADTAYRVIADHIRTLTFALTDGAVPSNVGRGYVLRRILRRAVRYGRQMLGAKTGFFAQLVPVVVDRFGNAFPELKKNPQKVIDIIKEEEESFGRTLDTGMGLFEISQLGLYSIHAKQHLGDTTEVRQTRDEHFKKHTDYTVIIIKPDGTKLGPYSPLDMWKRFANDIGIFELPQFTGKLAFKLYDTYGFPVDLTALMASERGLTVDMDGYEAERKKAEELSRAGGGKEGEKQLTLSGDETARLARLGIEATDDTHKFEMRDIRARVRAIWNGHSFDEHAGVKLAASARTIGIVTDRSNFYAEMGGQEGDSGRISVLAESRAHVGDKLEGGEFIVECTRSFGGYVLHIGHVAKGEVRVGDSVSMEVDKLRRAKTQGNHTATHLVNFALRKVLGGHVDQKGSLVSAERLRFDFSHGQPVSPEELGKAEAIVREQIREDLTVYAEPASIGVARQISGLRAVFGEQYPDPVRVVSIGMPVSDLAANPQNPAWNELSVEFCGGTHVPSTAMIGAFAIAFEEAVAKGVRRIVALSGPAAEAAIHAADTMEQRIAQAGAQGDAELARAIPGLLQEMEGLTMPAFRKGQLRARLTALQERAKAAEKELAKAAAAEAIRAARIIADNAQRSNELVVVTTVDAGDDRQALMAAVKCVRDTCPRAAVMLMSVDASNKVAVAASVPDWLIQKGLKAGDWVREACNALGGKGGGKHDNAQGGGQDASRLKEALSAAKAVALKTAM